MDPRIKLAQTGIRAVSAIAKSPTARRYTKEAINTLAQKGRSIWGVSAREIAELKKKGIKVNEYWRSGPNPGQR